MAAESARSPGPAEGEAVSEYRLAWKDYKLPGTLGQGYRRAAHFLREALAEVVDVIDADRASAHTPKAVIHFCPAHLFRPNVGSRSLNILFTMWEGPSLPSTFVKQSNRADAVLVPSTFNHTVWAEHGIPSRVVPLGVSEAFTDFNPARIDLRDPLGRRTKRIRFMFLGARTPRKGWPILSTGWRQAFDSWAPDDVQLYIKTMHENEEGRTLKEYYQGRVLIDGRFLSDASLIDLYREADVFLFPSMGEGFGLPPLEAMASGCLAVSTDLGGLSDFIDDSSAILIPRSHQTVVEYGVEDGASPFAMNIPTPDDLAGCLRAVALSWGSPALEAIRMSGCSRARAMTWARSARHLIDATSDIVRYKDPAGALETARAA